MRTPRINRRKVTAVLAFVVIAVLCAQTPAIADPLPPLRPVSPSEVTTTTTALPPLRDVDPAIETPTTSLPPLVDVQQSSPGLFDFGGHVREAIDGWFASLVTSMINPALDLLGKTLLSAPDVTNQPEVHSIWVISLVIANSIFVLFALVGGVIVMTHETVQVRYSAKEIAPRLVLAVIASNFSLLLAKEAIGFANALARAFLGDSLDPSQAVGGIGAVVLIVARQGGFMVLMALAVTVLCLILVGTYMARAIVVILLVAIGPIALACHALPQTEGLALLWWRATAGCLGIQVAQALVLVAMIRVFFAPGGAGALGLQTVSDGLVSLLITMCLMWVMLRIPAWTGRIVFGAGGGPVKTAGRTAMNIAKYALVFK